MLHNVTFIPKKLIKDLDTFFVFITLLDKNVVMLVENTYKIDLMIIKHYLVQLSRTKKTLMIIIIYCNGDTLMILHLVQNNDS